MMGLPALEHLLPDDPPVPPPAGAPFENAPISAPTAVPEPAVSQASTPVKPPRVWTVFVAYLGSWGVQLLAGVGVVTVYVMQNWQAFRDDQDAAVRGIEQALLQPNMLALAAMLVGLGGVLLAWTAAALSPVPTSERLQLSSSSSPGPAWAWFGAAFVVSLSWAAGVGALRELLFGEAAQSEHLKSLESAFTDADPMTLAVLVLGVGVLAPVAEELMFRGIIQSRLVQRWGAPVGIVVASVLFAVAHADPQHAISVLPMGLMLGWMAHHTGSIRVPILVHLLNNTFAVVTTHSLQDAPEWIQAAVMLSVLLFGITSLVTLARKRVLPFQAR